MEIDTKMKKISLPHCSCTAGASGECAHVLGVVMLLSDWLLEGLQDIPTQPSCTSVPQQWGKPRGTKIQAEPVSTMVIAKPGTTNRKRKPLTGIFEDNRKVKRLQEEDHASLRKLQDCPLSYLTSSREIAVETEYGPASLGSALFYQLPLIHAAQVPGVDQTDCGDLLLPKDFPFQLPASVVSNADKWNSVSLSLADAISLECNTREQSRSKTWHMERKKRITVSVFGRFMLRKAEVTEKFLDSVLNQRKFSSSATSYGTNSEAVAKNMYRRKTGNHVHDCGLLVNPAFPFLGATPDGKVCDAGKSGVLEIKCPFSLKDWDIKDAVMNYHKKHSLFLESVGGSLSLKKNHLYWFQVQGQLLVSGADFCDFVTYTRKDIHVERIFPDGAAIVDMLDKLCNIYVANIAE